MLIIQKNCLKKGPWRGGGGGGGACFSLKISFIIFIPFIFDINFKCCTCQYYCMIFQDTI